MCFAIKSDNLVFFLHRSVIPGSASIGGGLVQIMTLGVSLNCAAAGGKLIGLYGALHHFLKTKITNLVISYIPTSMSSLPCYNYISGRV